MRRVFEKICFFYTILFMTVASVPRCDLIVDAVAMVDENHDKEACHGENGESSEAPCQCQVHFAYLCLPDQLTNPFEINLDSHPMIDNASAGTTPMDHVGDIQNPPPRTV